MSFEVDATYENGVLKLDEALPLAEHQRVKVVVQDASVSAGAPEKQDWWQVLQEIWADQERRGYVGTVTEFDRGDEAYEKRMREIWSNTVHGQKGDADLP
jgi:predicted DNA-binding antitoxin AbrB/MazE fold protein